jgi:hypothetical protein
VGGELANCPNGQLVSIITNDLDAIREAGEELKLSLAKERDIGTGAIEILEDGL